MNEQTRKLEDDDMPEKNQLDYTCGLSEDDALRKRSVSMKKSGRYNHEKRVRKEPSKDDEKVDGKEGPDLRCKG